MNKRRIIKGVIVAALYIVFFVAVPQYLLGRLSPEYFKMLAFTSINIDNIVANLAVVGVVLAALSVARSVTPPRSAANLGLSIVSSIVRFYLLIFSIGVGNPWTFGIAQVTSRGGPATFTFTLDLRFFVFMDVVIMALQFFKAVLNYSTAKTKTEETSPQK